MDKNDMGIFKLYIEELIDDNNWKTLFDRFIYYKKYWYSNYIIWRLSQ